MGHNWQLSTVPTEATGGHWSPWSSSDRRGWAGQHVGPESRTLARATHTLNLMTSQLAYLKCSMYTCMHMSTCHTCVENMKHWAPSLQQSLSCSSWSSNRLRQWEEWRLSHDTADGEILWQADTTAQAPQPRPLKDWIKNVGKLQVHMKDTQCAKTCAQSPHPECDVFKQHRDRTNTAEREAISCL